MSVFDAIIAALSAAAAYYSLQILNAPASLVMASAFGLLAGFALTLPAAARKRKVIVQLSGLSWTREDFCRGWLITGDTGSGKTSSGINQLAHQVFRNEPTWGGLCIDEKGVYWETLRAMATHYQRSHDLIHIQIRPEDGNADWTPTHCFNLTGDRTIPFTTYAKMVVTPPRVSAKAVTKDFSKARHRRTSPTRSKCSRNFTSQSR